MLAFFFLLLHTTVSLLCEATFISLNHLNHSLWISACFVKSIWYVWETGFKLTLLQL